MSSDYSGPRETGGIVKFMKAQVGPASKDVSSPDDLVKVLAKPEVVVVSYSKDNEDVFLKVANGLRETVAFAHGATGKEGIVFKTPAAPWKTLFASLLIPERLSCQCQKETQYTLKLTLPTQNILHLPRQLA